MRVIHVDGVDIEVTRKAIRFLRLRIRPPHAVVCLSIPWHATLDDALRFAVSRKAWIQHHRARILASSVPCIPPVPLTEGMEVRLWGGRYVLRLEKNSRCRLELDENVLRLCVPDPSNSALCARALDRACRKLLTARIRALAVVWSPVLGVAVPELRIRSMKTRWGSCNPRAGRVWINVDLVRRSPEYLEYVLVHELAHLLERGHTGRFWAILDRHMPDWRHRRDRLNNKSSR